MRFLHLANWNSTNIGNGALALGAERVLMEDLGEGTTFLREPWDDYTFGLKDFDQSFVELVNSSCDALLINGAVTLNGRPYLKNAGMRFDLPLPLWDKITKPIVFYGISYRLWAHQKYHHLEQFKAAMNYILSHPEKILFAVRNDGTKEWLKKRLNIDSPLIYEIPDTGTFVPHTDDIQYPELDARKKNIIIAFNNEDETHRFLGFTHQLVVLGSYFWSEEKIQKFFARVFVVRNNKERFLKRLARVVERIAMEYEVNIILAPHYLDDYKMVGEFISKLKPRVAHQMTVSIGLLKVAHTKYFYGRYAKADLALTMRVHAMSPSIGMGVPVVPIVSQGRMTEYLSRIGLSDIAVNVFDQYLEETLYAKAKAILDDPTTIRKQCASAVEAMRKDLHLFNQKLSSFLE